MSIEAVSSLHTEQRNPNTIGFSKLSTLEMVEKINQEDMTVAQKVREVLPKVAEAVDLIVPRMRQGGRLVYVGCGTSGRLGYMDAAECAPTYGVAYDRVMCVMAGGKNAVFRPQENLEDSMDAAVEDLKANNLSPLDTVVAAAASGRTPYCIGALDYARSIGAGAVCVVCNPNSEMGEHAEVAIEVDTCCETIMGSTRMKAGTAQKMVMNMLSTIVMVQLGRAYDNLMIRMTAKNGKISNRIVRVFKEATGEADMAKIQEWMNAGGGHLDVAIAMYKSGKSKDEVEAVFAQTEDFYQALKLLDAE
uniref:N-acetylmuramic acid 6-phosphate etherase n=1 Tax=uncultured bacterium fosmid pJB148G3 TaxID=1478052 RepID=A0A0H3U8E0_9BACT|nr:hypothetical protein [uncultured bacterium fosmid pJB148G3]